MTSQPENQAEKCTAWRTALQNLENEHKKFISAYKDCIAAKDFTPLAPEKDKLKQAIANLREAADPYEVALRDRLAKKLGMEYVEKFRGDVTSGFKDGKWFLFDRQGNMLLKDEFKDGVERANDWNDGLEFFEGIAAIKHNDKYFFINQQGEKAVLKGEMADGVGEIGDFSDGFAAVFFSGRYMYLDHSGDPLELKGIRPEDIEVLYDFNKGVGFVSIKDNFKVILINKNGEPILKGELAIGVDLPGPGHEINEGFILVPSRKSKRLFFFDYDGNKLGGPKSKGFFSAQGFREGLAPVQHKSEGPWHFIDHEGKKVKFKGSLGKKRFEKVGWFKEGVAPVKIDGLWYYMDKQGNEVVLKGEFGEGVNEAVELSEGIALINDGNWFYINRNGEPILQGELADGVDQAFVFQEGIGIIKKNGRFFCVNKRGEMILKGKMANGVDHISPFAGGIATAKLDGKKYYIDRRGRIVF